MLRVFLVTVLACLLAATLLPITYLSTPRVIVGSIFGVTSIHGSQVLNYVDPLIGTINGGWSGS